MTVRRIGGISVSGHNLDEAIARLLDAMKEAWNVSVHRSLGATSPVIRADLVLYPQIG
jgi:hypothetical protein